MSVVSGLRTLVVGVGYMGRRHLTAYASHPHVNVVGAVLHTEASAASFAAASPIPAFVDLAEALAETRPEIVSVCTPTPLHAPQAAAALRAGAHVLVEKPLAANLTEGRALVELAQTTERTLMPAHTTLFEPTILALVRLARAGRLGALRRVRFERRGLEVSPGELEKGRGPGAPGRTPQPAFLYDCLIHVTYLLNRIAACAPVRVAVASRVPFAYEEQLRARVDYRSGLTAELDITSEPDQPFEKRLIVEGDAGAAEWSLTEGFRGLRQRRGRGELEPVAVRARGSAFDEVVHHFVDAVLAGRLPLERGEDGLRAMALAAALAGGMPTEL